MLIGQIWAIDWGLATLVNSDQGLALAAERKFLSRFLVKVNWRSLVAWLKLNRQSWLKLIREVWLPG